MVNGRIDVDFNDRLLYIVGRELKFCGIRLGSDLYVTVGFLHVFHHGKTDLSVDPGRRSCLSFLSSSRSLSHARFKRPLMD